MADSTRGRGRVAIVGGGPSGLVAAKEALAAGLRPTVLEKSSNPGGLWRAADGKVWQSLRTNLSKHTCAFSDFPWPSTADDFPHAEDVADYLERYARTFGLHACIELGARVTLVQRASFGRGYCVRWVSQGGTEQAETFEFAIIAAGVFSASHVPAELHGFQNQVVHASQYRDSSDFAGRRCLVLGAAFSGADAAASIARVAESVTLVASGTAPLYYLPRLVDGRPIDLALYSRAARDAAKRLSEAEACASRHAALARLGGRLEGLPSPRTDRKPRVAITDELSRAVSAGLLSVQTARVRACERGWVTFEDGRRAEFDVILAATGYRTAVNFLAPALSEAVEYDADDWLQPLIAHECVWPAAPNLAFVGMYRGPYFGVLELQARWACGVFAGRLPMPSAGELADGLARERAIRQMDPRPQFPHDYPTMADDLARHVGALPVTILQDSAHPLHALLYHGPLLPFHYRLQGRQANPRLAEAAIRECERSYPHLVANDAAADGTDPEEAKAENTSQAAC